MLAGETRPTFYFFTGSNAGSQNLATVWGAAPSPDDISLVRFLLTRNGREIKIGSFNLRGAKVGIDAKDALPFTVSDAAPGVIAVQPQIDLPPGEYGFVQTSAGVGVGVSVSGGLGRELGRGLGRGHGLGLFALALARDWAWT